MRKWIFLLSIVVSMKINAQDSLQSLAYHRNRVVFTGMKILGSWGIANIGTGVAGWAGAKGTNKYFYQMNTFWGAVNTGVALLGYRNAQRKMTTKISAVAAVKAGQKTERIFLVNTALDLVYIGAGAYVRNRGNIRGDARLKGYGSSVMLQGIFLTLFDAAMYKLQRDNNRKLKTLYSRVL